MAPIKLYCVPVDILPSHIDILPDHHNVFGETWRNDVEGKKPNYKERKETMIAYKLTNQYMQTFGKTQWQLGEWKETNGEGDLCGPGWLHYYSSPLLAVLLNLIHANFAEPRLFEAEVEGITKEDLGLKFGCTKMRLVKELQLPVITAEQCVKFAIYCALEVCADPAFIKWANKWLNGTDRSAVSSGTPLKVAYETSSHSLYYLAKAVEFYTSDLFKRSDDFRNVNIVNFIAQSVEEAVSEANSPTRNKSINLIALAEKAVS